MVAHTRAAEVQARQNLSTEEGKEVDSLSLLNDKLFATNTSFQNKSNKQTNEQTNQNPTSAFSIGFSLGIVTTPRIGSMPSTRWRIQNECNRISVDFSHYSFIVHFCVIGLLLVYHGFTFCAFICFFQSLAYIPHFISTYISIAPTKHLLTF